MRYYDLLADKSLGDVLRDLGFSDPGVDTLVVPSDEVDKAYAKDKLVFVEASNSLDKNRKILKMPCDGIVDPVFPKFIALDYPALTIAKDNNCAIVITLSKLYKYRGVQRANYLSRLRLLVRMALKKNVRIVLTTRAKTEFEVKSPLQLIAFGKALGMDDKQSKRSIGPVIEYVRGRIYDPTNVEG